MTPFAPQDRPDIDYDRHRTEAARLRSLTITGALVRAGRLVAPGRRAFLALLIAAGSFWFLMLNDPPTTVASDSGGAPTPRQVTAPLDLPVGR